MTEDTLRTTAKETIQLIGIRNPLTLDPKTTQLRNHLIKSMITDLVKTRKNLDIGTKTTKTDSKKTHNCHIEKLTVFK